MNPDFAAAITSSGPEMRNIVATMTGNLSPASNLSTIAVTGQHSPLGGCTLVGKTHHQTS